MEMKKRSRPWGEYLKQNAYRIFVLREVSSLFNAIYIVFFIVLLFLLGEGKDSYREFLSVLWSPPMMILHVVALAFALLHTVTWFNATGKAIVVRRGEERLPEAALAIPNYVAWAVVTVFIFWFLNHG
jgi:fumarate reductase subunit C